MSEPTFVESVLAGHALPEDIEDYVDAWHDSPVDLGDLPSFLGMTRAEYNLWVEHDPSLRYILAAHLTGSSVEEVRPLAGVVAAAARATDDAEAAGVLAWLHKTGRYAAE